MGGVNVVKALNAEHKRIIQFILEKKCTNYDELAQLVDRSKRTIAKYIDEINEIIQIPGFKVVAKQNKGVFFKGNTERLWDFLMDTKTHKSNIKEDRVMFVYSRFLSTSQHLKVQELADELYVSRATLEGTLKEVRQKFLEHGFVIENSRDGMKLKIGEKERRYLMSNLINYYWGGLSHLNDREDDLINQVNTSLGLKNVLNIEIMHKVISILNDFFSKTNLTCTDYEYKSLVIHLTIALERIKKNKFLNISGNNIQLLDSTMTLVKLIERGFAITIPQFEREYINNHMMAIEINVPNNQNREIVSIETYPNLKRILLDGLRYIDPDDKLLSSLALHLDSAIKRLRLGLSIHNPYTEKIKLSFPRAFDEAVLLSSILENSFDIQINDDERAYITLHIEAFFERHPDIKHKKDVVLVCSSGLGTSKLLEQRMKNNFENELNVTRVLSAMDLKHHKITEDAVISTIPLYNVDVPVIVVSPLLDSNDLNSIEKVLNLKPMENQKRAFLSYVDEDLLFVENGTESRNDVIKYICDSLLRKGYAKEGILESVIKREKISSTALGTFAMPHAQIDYILKPGISIYVNKNGIDWDGEKVNIVFFFAMNRQAKPIINQIYEFFGHVISDESLLSNLALVSKEQEILSLLKQV